MPRALLAEVAVIPALPRGGLLTYRVPPALAGRVAAGMRVRVPLRGRKVTGVIATISRRHDGRAREIEELLDTEPFLPAAVLEVCHWAADYYLATLAEVLAAVVPATMHRQRRPQETDAAAAEVAAAQALRLDPAQAEAVAHIEAAAGRFRALLLHGVTGSGKTEVYLRAAASFLETGHGVLILVPEISLTHRLVAEAEGRFPGRVAVLHSAMSPAARHEQWQRVRTGDATLVVGARSAVFAPVSRLGLVVVDEEHDAAYKQQEGLHYNARDLAVLRARLGSCPVVLASATPSAESYHHAQAGRYELLRLGKRARACPLPQVELIDLRQLPRSERRAPPLSPQLRAAIEDNLARGEQTLLFLNRRGFASYLQCGACGEALTCPRCSVTLTLHLSRRALCCHHCRYSLAVPERCPACRAEALQAFGTGTEQIETYIRRLYPGAMVARLDRDSTARRGAAQRILLDWHSGATSILVGTQIAAKGHDVPGVTLVGVLLADLALNLPDFRAAERTFQLLVQVAGRAGRGQRPGRVLVQSFRPDHPVLLAAAAQDYDGFMERELAERRALGYPPYTRLAAVRIEAREAEKAESWALALAERLRPGAGAREADVLGPAPAPLARLHGRYRWQLLIKSPSAACVHELAARAAAERAEARAAGVRLVVDVDPYNML